MENNETTYFVRLDNERLPLREAEKLRHALTIAEALLRICGVRNIREMPDGKLIYNVETFPENVPQANVHWLDASDTVTVFHGSPFEK